MDLNVSCPSCGTNLNDHVPANSRSARKTPAPTDLAICFHCGARCTFTDELKLRLLEDKEFSALPAIVQEEIVDAQTRIALDRQHVSEWD